MAKNTEKIIAEVMGVRLVHLKSGRPFLSEFFDISISHKDDIVEVKIVLAPYRIGIDVESLSPKIDANLFLGSVIARDEIDFLNKFRLDNDFSLESAVAIFWSIKESFFKCLDYDLKPGKLRIFGLSKEGKVSLALSPEIENIMKKRGLKIFLVEVIIRGNYVYAETIMKALQT